MSDLVLSQSEAERLIGLLKDSLINELFSPDPGEKKSFDVRSESDNKLFTIDIFRGRANKKKVQYCGRIKANGIPLLELHINSSNRHYNPGEKEPVNGTHWHIYREGFGMQYAYPAGELSSEEFIDNTIMFLKKFHVIKVPKIYDQEQLQL